MRGGGGGGGREPLLLTRLCEMCVCLWGGDSGEDICMSFPTYFLKILFSSAACDDAGAGRPSGR